MRPLPALVALALVVAACGDDDDDASDEPGIELSTSTLPDGPEPTPESETTVTPVPADPERTDPPGTLELNPPKTSVPVPPTTAGDPIGTDEALNPGEFDPGLVPFVELAVADLAVRLAVDPDDIEPISATLVTWSDSSMGCPLPGMQYAQVLQDGSLIELGHGETVYRYHTGGDRVTPFLCDAPLAVAPVATD
ncbi:MAG: hypothetical protein ACR2O6_12660 [Ilumatobacteraceae bacterium]